ncbi:MAG: GNAT family protein [Clostridia bacterium]|jgi:RimJ/RimL family protein N-acetyltransferase
MDKRLYLRAFEYDDLSFINQLRNNDMLFDLTCGNKYYISSERDKKWIEDKISNNYNQIYLMVCTKEDDKPIGYICCNDVDYINRKAHWSGLLLNEDFLNKGYGTESSILLIEYLFYELGMNLIYGFVRTDHPASVKMLVKVGMQTDGILRDYVFKRNRYHDVFLVSILKKDFENMKRST